MPEVVVVRGSGGVLYEMDVPTGGHALELWEEKLRKGDLVIVTDPVEWVDAGLGARKLQLVPPPADPDLDLNDDETEEPQADAVAPKPRRGRPPKNRDDAPTTEPDPEPTEE